MPTITYKEDSNKSKILQFSSFSMSWIKDRVQKHDSDEHDDPDLDGKETTIVSFGKSAEDGLPNRIALSKGEQNEMLIDMYCARGRLRLPEDPSILGNVLNVVETFSPASVTFGDGTNDLNPDTESSAGRDGNDGGIGVLDTPVNDVFSDGAVDDACNNGTNGTLLGDALTHSQVLDLGVGMKEDVDDEEDTSEDEEIDEEGDNDGFADCLSPPSNRTGANEGGGETKHSSRSNVNGSSNSGTPTTSATTGTTNKVITTRISIVMSDLAENRLK